MHVAHERVYTVRVERSPGRIHVRIPILPWSVVAADEHEVFAAWERYVQTQGHGFQWELDLGAETLMRRIVLPDE